MTRVARIVCRPQIFRIVVSSIFIYVMYVRRCSNHLITTEETLKWAQTECAKEHLAVSQTFHDLIIRYEGEENRGTRTK